MEELKDDFREERSIVQIAIVGFSAFAISLPLLFPAAHASFRTRAD